MFVKKVKTNKGIVEVGKYGIARIHLNENNTVDV